MLNWFTVRMAYITEEVSTFSRLFLLVCFLGNIITSVLRGVIKEEKRVNTPCFVTGVGFLPRVLCLCRPFLTSKVQTGSRASLRAPPQQGGVVPMERGLQGCLLGRMRSRERAGVYLRFPSSVISFSLAPAFSIRSCPCCLLEPNFACTEGLWAEGLHVKSLSFCPDVVKGS